MREGFSVSRSSMSRSGISWSAMSMSMSIMRNLALNRTILLLSCRIDRRHASSRTVIMAVLHFVDAPTGNCFILGYSLPVTADIINCCVDVASKRFSGALCPG